jgi:hypothetical protein
MNATHRKTLAAIFADPVKSDLRWKAVESLLVALGAKIKEGRGSRIVVELNGTQRRYSTGRIPGQRRTRAR